VSGCDHCHDPHPADTARYRRVLWAVLAINAGMALVEIVSGLQAGSLALQADALDFMGDAANYGISLFVLSRAIRWRASAALVKGAAMGLFGIWLIATALWKALHPELPGAGVMGAVGTLALVANLAGAALLYRFRDGDANRRSVWLCTRNDAIGNLAVLAAAAGVVASETPWPDLAVGAIMAGLALSSSWHVLRRANGELRGARTAVTQSTFSPS
jgi:cation diffusion facilitator family transporter